MRFLKKYLKSRRQEKNILRNLNVSMGSLVKRLYFHDKAMNSKDNLITTLKSELPLKVISLTTYSKRIHDVYLVIESLGEQTIKANKIVLWLDEAEFCMETIPEILRMQMKRGLDVRFCHNIRSYKKLIPSLIAFSDADIITVDDDFIYPHDLVEALTNAQRSSPHCIVGMRGHTIAVDNGKIKPYKEWDYESTFEKNGFYTFLTTGAGTLFPARLLADEFFDEESFMALCPSADDVWINFMCIKHGIERRKVCDDRSFSLRFTPLTDNQDMALCNVNVHQKQNDVQIKRMLEKYTIKFK